MNNLEMINDLIARQKLLDKAFLENLPKEMASRFTYENMKQALIDELGEVNHELKANWCWWKKTQAPVNREKLLEELADAWHFAIEIHYTQGDKEMRLDRINENLKYRSDYLFMIEDIIAFMDPESILYQMIKLTNTLGFAIEELYHAYIKKDEENYNRIARGY